ARLIKEQANKEAELILEAAQKLQDSIKFQAEQNGYQDGYSKGLKQGAMEVRSNAEESLKEMEKLLKVINYERLEAVKRHETDILQISFEVAKKIMRQHILSDSEAILQMIEEIYRKYEYEHETNVKITIPEYSKVIDVEIDKNIAKRISEQIENSKVIISKNDDFIMIESDNSAVDASFDLQINQLKEEVIL
ncbi:MAG TPA: FliH/SctL family protein, partial [Anaerovoracaceae bacterium]|nr:FliH/SctL family protein [Anaerovoracaceae bacterium]